MHQLLSILKDPKRQSNPLTSSVMDLRGVGKYIQTLTSTITVINSNVFWRCSSLYSIDWVSSIQPGGREACNEILQQEPNLYLLLYEPLVGREDTFIAKRYASDQAYVLHFSKLVCVNFLQRSLAFVVETLQLKHMDEICNLGLGLSQSYCICTIKYTIITKLYWRTPSSNSAS